jgi:phospholipid/cholesterol/gamma-HCH transport system substrate-binding protein
MGAKSQSAIVGIFVLVAVAVLVAMVFAISGMFGGDVKEFHVEFAFAGGIEPGTTVRYAGGPKVGRVEHVQIDPQNPALIDITFAVQSSLPVKTDSRVKILSMSPLGDNHLEIFPGTPQSPAAAPGSMLHSDAYLDFNALAEKINDMAPQAQQLLATLNDRATELRVTIDRVNGLLSPQNQANLSATLASTRAMVDEDRPEVKATLQHLNDVSTKLGPLLDNVRKTSDQANQTLNHIDAMIGENQPDIRKAVQQLRQALANMTEITGKLDQTLDVNSENIDELLENLRLVSENMKEFTDTIKARPYLLIRSGSPKEHKPGQQP